MSESGQTATNERVTLVRAFMVVALFLAGLGVVFFSYLRGVDGPLLFDDYLHIAPLLRPESLQNPFSLLLSNSGPLMRPLSMATFAVNALTAGPDIAEWKTANVVLHLANAIVAAWLASLVFAVAGGRATPLIQDWAAGSICALLWAAHPLNVSTVLYLVQRMAQLSALFTFAALLCYVMGRLRQEGGRVGVWHILLSALLFAPLAILSKENGALTYPLMILFELILFRRLSERGSGRYGRRMTIAAIAVVIAAGAAMVLPQTRDYILSGYATRPFTLTERLLTETRVLVLYLGQLLVPSLRSMSFYYDDYVISKSLFDPIATALSATLLLILGVTAVIVRRTAPVVALGILFFFVGHLMESTVLPLELAFEHRNYLPGFGIMLAVIALLWRISVPVPVRVLASSLLICTMAALTLVRAGTWSNDFAIAANALRARPASDAAASLVAERLTQEGRLDEAQMVLTGHPSPGRALQQIYIACLSDKRVDGKKIRDVANSFPPYVDSYMLTGLIEVSNMVLDKRCDIPVESTLDMINAALTKSMWAGVGSQSKLEIYRAHLLWAQGERTEAVASLLNAHARDDDDVVMLLLAARFAAEMGEKESARKTLNKALASKAYDREEHGELVAEIERLMTRYPDR
jgi:hypothetical protein